MVIVPSLAEDDRREKGVVPRRVCRLEPPRSPEVPGGVDEERGVEGERRRDPEAPHEARPAHGERAHRARRERGDPFEAIEPAKLGEASELSDVRKVRAIVLAAQDPAQVRVPKASEHRRVRVAWMVREAMVTPVTACPPERPVLHRRATEPAQHELEEAARLECVVGEVPVVARRDAERLEQVAAGAHERGHATSTTRTAPAGTPHERPERPPSSRGSPASNEAKAREPRLAAWGSRVCAGGPCEDMTKTRPGRFSTIKRPGARCDGWGSTPDAHAAVTRARPRRSTPSAPSAA